MSRQQATVPVQIPNALDLNGDGKVTLNEVIIASFWIVFWIVLAMNVINACGLATLYVIRPWGDWDVALRWSVAVLFVSIAIGFLAAGWTGISRSRLPERQWREMEVDMGLRRDREEFELEQIKGIITREDERRGWTAAVQDRFAKRFLTLSYEKGSLITRKEWTAKGLPEDAWNRVNEVLKSYGIRNGKSSNLVYDTLAEAWAVWIDKTTKTQTWNVEDRELVPR